MTHCARRFLLRVLTGHHTRFATTACHRTIARTAGLLFALAALLAVLPEARAWDARTHKSITKLAVTALPASPLKTLLESNLRELLYYSVEPDIRRRYDRAEGRRHYIDLEDYGSDPFAVLEPSRRAMMEKFGRYRYYHAGTLPWTIEFEARMLRKAFAASGQRAEVRVAGLLSHYVADASQPLHTTGYERGYNVNGEHRRFEAAVDQGIPELTPLAAREVRLEPVKSVWQAEIAELRRAHELVGEVVQADHRAMSANRYAARTAYRRALLGQERAMVAAQLADGASVLASIWQYEWSRAGQGRQGASDRHLYPVPWF